VFSRPLMHRARPAMIILAACLGWASLNAWWLVVHRTGQPLNIDEAGYLGIALSYAGSWERGGFSGWLTSVMSPTTQAPLTTALTSIPLLSGRDPVKVGFAVVLAFAVATLLLTAAAAWMTRRRTVVVLSLVLVLTTPGFIALSRSYAFAVPAAAATMAAVFALMRSRGLTRLPWSMAFGVALGLMPMARTMTIAFVPVLVVVAVANAAAHRSSRLRQVGNLAGALVLAAGVASIWLVPSAQQVLGYLTSYGYGSHSAEYTNHAPSPPVALLRMLSADYFVPHLVLIAVGWCAVVGVVVALLRRGSFRARARDMIASPMFVPAAFCLGASVALMSSRNAGWGFTIPLLAPAALVAARGWSQLLGYVRHAGWRAVGVATLVAVGALLASPSFDSRSPLTGRRTVAFLGAPLTVTVAKIDDPAYYTSGSLVVTNSPSWGGQWAAASERIVADVLDDTTARRFMAFGFRSYFVNVNTAELVAVEQLHYGVAAAQIDPTSVGSTTDDYRSWLTTGPAAGSCDLMTSAGEVNEFKPVVDTASLEAAAIAVGFQRVDEVPMPDGRSITVWERHGNGC